MAEPRCLDCGYILTGLESGRCSECGRAFDWSNTATYTTKPLFDRWRFWLPGFLLALISGLVLYPVVIYYAGFRWTLTLLLPLCLGTLIGYGCRVSRFFQVLLALILLAGVVVGLYSASFVGVFCGLVLAAVALGPLIIGTVLGSILRGMMKNSSWDQRWHLPTLLALFAPILAGAVEARFESPYIPETVNTSVVLPASEDRAWNAVMLYEEVRGRPPLLMRFALPHPLYTQGKMESVGDLKICVYSKGRLVKRITKRVPKQILSFDVVEQTKIENRSVVLQGGSFQFAPVDVDQTRVTLSTKYQRLLGPRWAWRWSEHLGIHTLHEYVLNGMRLKAAAESARQPQPVDGGAS